MQIIRSNLRGGDSPIVYFKKLPQVIVVSYQGSESSTSEGINMIFKKAESLVHTNSIPVVLLDEVGLAELSKSKPLKVLHSRLEAHTKDGRIDGINEQKLNVGVVGISNWELDASKMNRAIQLSRPEPDLDDLTKTGLEISKELTGKTAAVPRQYISQLATGYADYMKSQQFVNFHGLRDYYCLVKQTSGAYASQSTTSDRRLRKLKAIFRNFGGLETTSNVDPCQIIGKTCQVDFPEIPAALDLIKENLEDLSARHLLLISNGDSAIDLLQYTLEGTGFEPVVIYGSKFDYDTDEQSEQYNYRILSRIILYMETGKTLVLKDLESIYGSLYDLLNQSYTEVMGKKNCRIAHGPYSSPLCPVHDHFRCIVLQDIADVAKADPPFLNRFEKQLLRFDDVLNDHQVILVKRMQEYLIMSVNYKYSSESKSSKTNSTEFTIQDAIAGMHCDLLPSLVYKLTGKKSQMEIGFSFATDKIIVYCLKSLLRISTMDFALRLSMSKLGEEHGEWLDDLQHEYFEMPQLSGLKACINNRCCDQPLSAIIMTYSNVHTNIEAIIDPLKPLVVRLSSVKSEEQFLELIRPFWNSTAHVLAVQCIPGADSNHVLYAKFVLDQMRKERLRMSNVPNISAKHICIIMHVDRNIMENLDPNSTNYVDSFSRRPDKWQFNFLCGWDLIFIDQLEQPNFCAKAALSKSIPELYAENLVDSRKIAKENLGWCLWCMRWPKNCSFKDVQQVQNKILSSEIMMNKIRIFVCNYLTTEIISNDTQWLVKLAFNKQQLALYGSLQRAAETYVVEQFRNAMAKFLYVVLKECLLDTLLNWFDEATHDNAESHKVFERLLEKMISSQMRKLPNPSGIECYSLSMMPLCLKFPFSFILYKKMRDNIFSVIDDNDSDDTQDPTFAAKEVQKTVFSEVVAAYVRPAWQHYEDDFYTICSYELGLSPDSLRWVYGKLLHLPTIGTKSKVADLERLIQPADLHWLLENQETTIRGLTALYKASLVLNINEFSECSTGVEKMVEIVCKNLVCMDKSVVKCGCLVNWDNLARYVLSVIYEMDDIAVSSEVLALIILSEFVSSVAIPFHVANDTVFMLANTVQLALPDELHSTNFIQQLQIVLLDSEVYGRASESDAKTAVAGFLNNALFRLLDDNNYRVILLALANSYTSPGAALLLSQCMEVYVAEKKLDLTSLLTNDAINIVKQNSFFQALDDCIKSTAVKNDVSSTEIAAQQPLTTGTVNEAKTVYLLDGWFSVLCCSIFENKFYRSLVESINTDKMSSLLRHAGGIIANPAPTVTFVNAIAVIRAILSRCGHLLADEMQNPGLSHKHLIETTNKLLEQSDELGLHEEMRYLMLRPARRCVALNNIAEKLSVESKYSESYSWTRQVDLRDVPFDEPCGFNPFSYLHSYWHVDGVMKAAIRRGAREEFRKLLVESTKSAELFRSVTANIASYLTLQGSKSRLSSEENSFIDWLTQPDAGSNMLLSTVVRSLLSPYPFSPFYSEHIDGQQNVVYRTSVMVRLLVLLLPKPDRQLPFYTYLTDLVAAQKQFVITCYREAQISLTSRQGSGGISDAVTAFCVCQYRTMSYSSGFAARCSKCPLPSCGKKLPNNVCGDCPTVQQKIVNYEAGYSSVISWDQDSLQFTSPVSFFVLRCLLHMTVMVGLSAKFYDREAASIFLFKNGNVPLEEILRFLDSTVETDWQTLRTALAITDENLALLFHSILQKLEMCKMTELRVSRLTSPKARARWEKHFAQLIQPLLKNVKRTVKEHRRSLNISAQKFHTPAQEAVEESSVPLLRKCGNLRCGKNFFRHCASPSIDDMYATLTANDRLKKKHAFLWLVICSAPYLKLIKLMRPLLAWVNEVYKVSSFQLSRRNAMKLPQNFIKVFYEHESDQANIRTKFEDFCSAWRAVAKLELIPVEGFPLDQNLSEINPGREIGYSCLGTSGNGCYLFTILSFLVDIQNRFLSEVETLLETTPECTSLTYLRCHHTSIGHVFPRVALQKCNPLSAPDILEFEWPEHLLYRSTICCEYGKGDEVDYDFFSIEKNLVTSLQLTGKSYLCFDGDSIEPFPYAGELCRNFSRILAEVEEKSSEQIELSQELTETIKLTVDPSTYGKILASLELLFCHVKRAESVDKNDTLQYYFQFWLKDHTPQALLVNEQTKKQVCVKHVINVYLLIEELQADNVLSSLPTEFTKPLQDSSKVQIRKLGNYKSAFLSALRRFMFRNLMEPDGSIEPTEPLLQYFHQLEWAKSFKEVSTVKSLFSDDILLENALDLYRLLKQLIEDERSSTTARLSRDHRRKRDKTSRGKLF
ncbi:E3 ubiquitin-protein ligase RNF213-like [Corticium candelabrum]|uniref:E3 ubiquitin-protein ligase RNF213-like n=1 Tax=Corticium candelabrum TaxID=121492 RepID=UPI002E269C85|nr:E3 ubiquitin-protein ligase RNF213-like [Corticium candelabrum]